MMKKKQSTNGHALKATSAKVQPPQHQHTSNIKIGDVGNR
jgi:hypothetical protein